MKKNEAISILATSLRPREPKDRARYDEAVKMAVDALNKPEPYTTTHDSIPAETGENDGDGTSGDCISRAQAIYIASGYCHPANIATELAKLPSVQPEIIRCKDCKRSRFFDPCFYCYKMGGEIIVPENGFCFKAERREDG